MNTWVSLCGGSAALECVLTGGPSAKPPTSYQGSKRGYWKPILGAFGLAPGSRPRVILAEPGPYGNVWRILSTPGGPQAVAEVIRGWEGEEPRALWMRLRDEWRKDPELRGAREVAGWIVEMSWSFSQSGSGFNPDCTRKRIIRSRDGREDWIRPATPAKMAAAVEAVARWLLLSAQAYKQGQPESGFNDIAAGCRPNPSAIGNWATVKPTSPEVVATATARSPSSGWTIYDRAQDVPIPDDASECYVYIDPPYVGTTGYRHDLPREEVIRLALAWADRGAFVGISEQVPIEIPGWHPVRIDQERTGAKRTRSRQQVEWLTLSRPPVIRPSAQAGLFAGPVVG